MAEAKCGKIIEYWPDNLLDITETDDGKFMIKFTADDCPGCVNLQNLIESMHFNVKEDIKIFNVKAKDPNSTVFADLRSFFKFKTLPVCVITDNSLKEFDRMDGFKDPNIFKELIKKNFN